MPHQCTECGEDFPDGSKEMLSGCPTCGGNTFQYLPPGADIPDDPGDAPTPPGQPNGLRDRATSTVKEWVAERARGSALDPMSGTPPESPPTPDGAPTADEGTPSVPADGESPEQRAARTDVATPEEAAAGADEPLEAAPAASDGDNSAATQAAAGTADTTADADPAAATAASLPADEAPNADADTGPPDDAQSDLDDAQPDLADLRAELNDQFESIRIVEPGEYELNLMQLYEREEHVIALREDGRYVIDIPDARRGI
jgi:predicted  nucleic acid-binding Zn-ribbon protein